jgi:hypothetical protein
MMWIIQHFKQPHTRKPDASGTHINNEETINAGKIDHVCEQTLDIPFSMTSY